MTQEHTVKKYDDELDALSTTIVRMGGAVEAQLANAIQALVRRDTELAAQTAAQIIERGIPERTILNLNVPDGPREACKGIVACALGERCYEVMVDKRTDPRGRPYYWLGGKHRAFVGKDSDGDLIGRGYATLTPMQADLTHQRMLSTLKEWPLTLREDP